MTSGASPQQRPTSPGWYWAEGDPPDSVRYWGGDEWLTGPTQVEEFLSKRPPVDLPVATIEQPTTAGAIGSEAVVTPAPFSSGLVAGSILWNILLFVAWVLVLASLAFHGAFEAGMWFLGGDSDFINLPSWFVWTWLYLAGAPVAAYAISWGRTHRSDNALIASLIIPAIPVAIALLAFAEA